jgi:predicted amidophosphoribosyltransferase
MLQIALLDYVPKRFLSRATFDQIIDHYAILSFKDGRNVYSRWAARLFARALAATDMKDVVIVCIPASTRTAHVRRWKRFSGELCRLTGASDGFDRIQVSGSRQRAHVTGEYELCTNIKHYVHIDADFFRGKRVLVIDDIYTTGQSSSAFISAMQAAGADVLMALFLARTKLFCMRR